MNYVSMDFNLYDMIVSLFVGAVLFWIFHLLYSIIFDVLIKILRAYTASYPINWVVPLLFCFLGLKYFLQILENPFTFENS